MSLLSMLLRARKRKRVVRKHRVGKRRTRAVGGRRRKRRGVTRRTAYAGGRRRKRRRVRRKRKRRGGRRRKRRVGRKRIRRRRRGAGIVDWLKDKGKALLNYGIEKGIPALGNLAVGLIKKRIGLGRRRRGRGKFSTMPVTRRVYAGRRRRTRHVGMRRHKVQMLGMGRKTMKGSSIYCG